MSCNFNFIGFENEDERILFSPQQILNSVEHSCILLFPEIKLINYFNHIILNDKKGFKFFDIDNYASINDLCNDINKYNKINKIILNLHVINNNKIKFILDKVSSKKIYFIGAIREYLSDIIPYYELIVDPKFILETNLEGFDISNDMINRLSEYTFNSRPETRSSLFNDIENLSLWFSIIKDYIENNSEEKLLSFGALLTLTEHSQRFDSVSVELFSMICFHLLFSCKKNIDFKHISPSESSLYSMNYNEIKRLLKTYNFDLPILEVKEYIFLFKDYFETYNGYFYIKDKTILSYYAALFLINFSKEDAINLIVKNCFSNNHFDDRFVWFFSYYISHNKDEYSIDDFFKIENTTLYRTLNIEVFKEIGADEIFPNLLDRHSKDKSGLLYSKNEILFFENYFSIEYFDEFLNFFNSMYEEFQTLSFDKIAYKKGYYKIFYYFINCKYYEIECYLEKYKNDEIVRHVFLYFLQFRNDSEEIVPKLNEKELSIFNTLKEKSKSIINRFDPFYKKEFLKTFKGNTDKFNDFLLIIDAVNTEYCKNSFLLGSCINYNPNKEVYKYRVNGKEKEKSIIMGRHKDENHISDHLKNILKTNFGLNSIREDQLEDARRMDFSISDSFDDDFFIVEAKGFWNTELTDLRKNNIEKQLLDYLRKTKQRNAVYLVYSYEESVLTKKDRELLLTYETNKDKIKDSINIINKKYDVNIVFKELVFRK